MFVITQIFWGALGGPLVGPIGCRGIRASRTVVAEIIEFAEIVEIVVEIPVWRSCRTDWKKKTHIRCTRDLPPSA